MKKISLLTFAIAVSLVFSSCSNQEALPTENENADLLKTFKVKRDATGAYSLDFEVSENAKVDKVLDTNGNASEFYLYSSDNAEAKKITQDLLIDGEQLKIGFVDAKTNNSPNITIIDDNLSIAKKSNDNAKLNSYSIGANADGTYQLDFKVNDNVNVDFVYNEETSVYEVHLEYGKVSDSNFSRVLESEEGKVLKVDFVNHISNSSAKSAELSMIRKPIIIIDPA